MAETAESLASLFKLGKTPPPQPPRFAKVTAVSGDTATVTLGVASADTVRCCDCTVGDVVLLETMPSGQLAAVAVKGYNGGSGGVQSVTVGTVSGATFANSGTASNVVLDLAVPTYSTLTCTENSGGYTWSQVFDFTGDNRYGWREEKWSDGRLSVWVWDYWTLNATPRSCSYTWPAGATPFTSTPTWSFSAYCTTTNDLSCHMHAMTTNTSATVYAYRSGGSNTSKAAIAIRFDGHWQ